MILFKFQSIKYFHKQALKLKFYCKEKEDCTQNMFILLFILSL